MKFTLQGKSLLELKEEYGVGGSGFQSFWWKGEPFAQERSEAGEYEILLETPYFTDLTFEEQKKQVPKGYKIAHAAIIAEALLTHYKNTGEKLMSVWWGRTNVLGAHGSQVDVGRFRPGGLNVSFDWGSVADPRVGLSVARKLSKKLATQENCGLTEL